MSWPPLPSKYTEVVSKKTSCSPVKRSRRWAGRRKAYSGVTDEEIKQLTEIFMKLAREQRWGRVFIVEPTLVLEIECDQIQPSDRHESGYAMRFPRIARLRPDKPVSEIDTLQTVRQIAGR